MNFNIDKIFEITCVCVLRCRDNELLNQARAEGREEGVELLLRRVEADFVTECLLPLSRGVQALLLAIRFNGQEAAMQAAAELEEAACSLFTRTDSYADKIVSARVLVLCYLFLNNFLATDGSEADVGNAVDHIHAMFEELCECPEVASAIHFELAKKTFSSLPGGRRSRQAALADLADLRQDVQTFTRYVLDVKDDKKETVFLHSIKPYQAVVHSRAINRALVYRQHLFTASADGTVKMFDCVTMSEKGLLVGHKKDVLSMAASDGRLFTGSRDKTIRIWDLLTLKESKICFRKHQNAVTALVTMGHKLYSASTDGTILVWDISTGPLRDVPVGILQGHRDGIEALCPMPLRSRLMSGGRDSVIKVWDVVAMCELFCFSNSGVTAAVMAVSPDEDLLFTSSWDNTLKVWNMRDVTESPRIVRGHGAPVTALAVSCDRVYSGAGDGVCKVWSISTLLELSSHSGHAEGVTCIAPDRGTFFSTSSDKSIIRHFSSLEELPMGEA